MKNSAPPEVIDRIRELVDRKMTDAEIGRQMGMASSTVNYHRQRHKIASKSKFTAEARAQHAAAARRARELKRQTRHEIKPPVFDPMDNFFTGPLPEKPDRDARYLRMSCQYIAGDPRTDAKCGASRHVGYPYCEHHARICIKAVVTPKQTGKPFTIETTRRL